MDTRRALLAIGWGRIGIGACLLLLPGLAGRVWIGRAGREATSKAVMRAVGGRDLAIGGGTLMALQLNQPLRQWIAAGAVADCSDAVATLLSYRHLPRGTRSAIALTAAATAAAEVALGSKLRFSDSPQSLTRSVVP